MIKAPLNGEAPLSLFATLESLSELHKSINILSNLGSLLVNRSIDLLFHETLIGTKLYFLGWITKDGRMC